MRSSGHVREDTGSSRRRIGVRGAMKRTVLISFLVASLLLAGCGQQGSGESEQGGSGPKESCDLKNPPLFKEGVLTVATDKPAYPPWFEGDPEHYSGYEGEVANEVAERMDLPIEWVVEPFNKSYAPGAKDYDFDINQITITPEREQAVDFSEGYFDDSQGVLVLKDSPVADAKSISDLKDAKLGAQVGTTSLDFINETIQPNEEPKVYDTTNDAKSALESGQIDAIVTDLVTTVYLRDFEIKNTEVVGQYPRNEQFGMLFEQGNPLVGCVNEVLGEMKEDGTLQDLKEEYLQQYLSVPTLKE
jgi:polar amino acid transport system substrate-binding protein